MIKKTHEELQRVPADIIWNNVHGKTCGKISQMVSTNVGVDGREKMCDRVHATSSYHWNVEFSNARLQQRQAEFNSTNYRHRHGTLPPFHATYPVLTP